MNTYLGTYFILMLEDPSNAGQYFPVAHATSHNISLQRASRDVSSKSSGISTSREYGRYTASASVDGLISFNTGIANIALLRTQLIAGAKIKVMSVLMDYETAGKAPIADTPSIVVQDAAGDDAIDSATTTVETTADVFAIDSIMTESMTPQLCHFDSVIASVEESGSDGDTPTFSASFESDGIVQLFGVSAFSE